MLFNIASSPPIGEPDDSHEDIACSYTNRHWWDQRLGNRSSGLQDYGIWISHYGGSSTDSPPMMPGFEWAIWQFTDKGGVSGIPVDIDVNLLDPRLEVIGTPGK